METSSMSINQLCDFVTASERRKVSIVEKQKYPSTYITSWYVTARSCMRNFIKNNFSYIEIFQGLERLKGKISKTKRQEDEKNNSILALEKFLEIKFPERLKNKQFTFSKAEHKSIIINGVNVIISPDIILNWVIDDNH